MGTKSGELREMLVTVIEEVKSGKCTPDQAKAIAMLAGQVNLSMQVEINAQKDAIGKPALLGHMPLGEENNRVVSEQ